VTTLPTVVTVEQASRIVGVSRRHAYKLVKDGVIPSVRLGGAIRVPTHALLRLLNAPAGQAAAPQSSASQTVPPPPGFRSLASAAAGKAPKKAGS
jgi:excisionase family DNA binding protein